MADFRQAALNSLGYAQLIADNAVLIFDATIVPAGTRFALMQAEGGTLRWRDDGVSPTTTVGMRMLADTVYQFFGDINKFRVIRAVGGAGTLSVTFYK